MAGQKITELTQSTAQSGDLIPIARGNTNYSVPVQSITALGGTGTVTQVGGTGTVSGITLTGSVSNSGNLTLGGAIAGVDLSSQTTGNLPVSRLNSGTNASSTTFWRGDGTWQSISASSSSGAAINTRPIVGMIAHSYGNNTCSQAHITSYQIVDSAGTLAVSTWNNLGLSTPNDYVRLWGLGSPYDGIYAITSAAGYSTNTTGTLSGSTTSATQTLTASNPSVLPGMVITGTGVPGGTQVQSVNGATFVATQAITGTSGTVLTFTQPFVLTMYNQNLDGTPAQSAPTLVSPMGKAFVSSAGSSGTGAGLIPQGGIPWANAYLGHAYEFLPNYVYNVSGGKIVPTSPNDPGFVQMCTNLTVQKSAALPKYVFIDHGVNDANGAAVLSTVQNAAIQGLAILKAAGITPIWLVPRPFENAVGAYSAGQWCQSFTAWLKSYMQKVGGICIDTNQLLVDPSSATNGWLPGTNADPPSPNGAVHLSTNGGIRDGRLIAQQLAPIFRACSGFNPSNSDIFSTAAPLSNMLPSPVANFPGGTFPSTVASATVPKTDTPIQMGTLWVQAWSASTQNAGNRTISAAVQARTDTTQDGTLIPGNELKITFSAGTGVNSCNVQFANNTSGLIYLTSNYQAGGTPLLSIGDQFQMDVEIYIPLNNPDSGLPNLEPSVIYAVPAVSCDQNLQYANGAYRRYKYGTFTNGSTLFNRVNGTSTASNLGTDMRLAGIGESGTYKPSAVISTPPLRWTGNYNGTGTNIYVVPMIQVGITSGSNANPFVVYIRGVSLRKIDSTAAYPYF